VPPTDEESQGILLRLQMPPSGVIKAKEELEIFSQLRDGQGIHVLLHQNSKIAFSPVAGQDGFLQKTVTTFQGKGGQILEEIEVSPRGEILRLIRGHHQSPAGLFTVVSAARTPVYPEGLVKPGDSWRYEEKMDVRLKSVWVKEKNPTPYLRQVQSVLMGFAEVNGHRCAVIKSLSDAFKTGELKILFKTVILHIQTHIEETEYLDYKRGMVIARITKTTSHSASPSTGLEDHGLSQSLYTVESP
jgi:hypothetical protein